MSTELKELKQLTGDHLWVSALNDSLRAIESVKPSFEATYDPTNPPGHETFADICERAQVEVMLAITSASKVSTLVKAGGEQ